MRGIYERILRVENKNTNRTKYALPWLFDTLSGVLYFRLLNTFLNSHTDPYHFPQCATHRLIDAPSAWATCGVADKMMSEGAVWAGEPRGEWGRGDLPLVAAWPPKLCICA